MLPTCGAFRLGMGLLRNTLMNGPYFTPRNENDTVRILRVGLEQSVQCDYWIWGSEWISGLVYGGDTGARFQEGIGAVPITQKAD